MTESSAAVVANTVVTAPEPTELRRAVTGPVWDPGAVEGVAEIAGLDLAPVHGPLGVLGGRRRGLR